MLRLLSADDTNGHRNGCKDVPDHRCFARKAVVEMESLHMPVGQVPDQTFIHAPTPREVVELQRA